MNKLIVLGMMILLTATWLTYEVIKVAFAPPEILCCQRSHNRD